MKPHITIITLGVEDLQRAIDFYQNGLGLPRKDESEGIAFFNMTGTILALYPRNNWLKILLSPPTVAAFKDLRLPTTSVLQKR